jgi:hypothetical protein
MTLSEALHSGERGSALGLPPLPPRLVLVAAGPPESVGALLQQAAPALARVLGAGLGTGLGASLGTSPAPGLVEGPGCGEPAGELAALLAGEPPFDQSLMDPSPMNQSASDRSAPGPVLVPLLLDPGFSLENGSCWAEALGAWRQPTVAVLGAEQLRSGLPAAMTALLRQAAVPLAGLVQWGLPWEPERRRREALPWLGALDSTAAAAAADSHDLGRHLALALRLACTKLG